MGFVLTQPTATNTGGSGVPGLTITVINGQPMITLEDTTRANKILSVAEQSVVFAENALSALDWIRVGTTNDADSGFIGTYDGTIIAISAHCENTNANSKNIHLYLDSVDQGSLGTLSGGVNATVNDTTLNIDFNQGTRIRLRAEDGSGGNIQDTIVKLTIKWRGV